MANKILTKGKFLRRLRKMFAEEGCEILQIDRAGSGHLSITLSHPMRRRFKVFTAHTPQSEDNTIDNTRKDVRRKVDGFKR